VLQAHTATVGLRGGPARARAVPVVGRAGPEAV